MNKSFRVAALLLLSVFIFQCQKDLSYIGAPDTGVPVASNPIKVTLQGNIIDENEQPAAGVSITVGTKTVMTNGSGYFRITDASLDKNTSLVTAQKAGYFRGYRVFAATSGVNQVVIKLIKKNLARTITASSGGTATLSNGAKISLPANGVVVASSGAAYSGDVNVYAAYIDPKASDIAETVPGSFAANNKNGKRVILSSYGMLAVELESAAGEKLQIKSGAVATLTSPIPSSSLSSAPATIALWYVDEQTGVWKEEGTTTKQGNNYVGDVKHFSFWGFNYPADAVSLSITLHNGNDLPIIYAHVMITAAGTATDTGSTGHGWTDSSGNVKGLVPANQNLLLKIFDNCGNSVFSKNIGSLSKNTDLGVVTLPNSTNSLLIFSGTLLNCSGEPVKKGYSIINFDNVIRYAATDANGKYVTSFITCQGTAATASVLGVDESTNQQSATSTVTVTAPLTDAGNITACGTSASQYLNFTLDGVDYTITSSSPATDTLVGYNDSSALTTVIYGSKVPSIAIKISTNNVSGTGTFPVSNFYLHRYNNNSYNNIVTTQPFNVTFTSFAKNTGEFYEGTLSGKFKADAQPQEHTISVTFKVRRIY